jgi:lysophospholipase L1-like esterase
MRRFRWLWGGLILVLVAVLVGVFALSGTEPTRPPERTGPPGTGPLTLVTLGDSTLSGEGAGDYTPDTNGLNGNWCHRSPHATANETKVPGIEATVNLACSGAPAGQVALGSAKQWGEPSQAQRLAELTRTHRVAAVVIAVGANDDPHFSRQLSDCFMAWFTPANPPCSAAVAPNWQAQVDAMVPKATNAVGDVKKVLANAGYRPEDYQIVLQSYASPIGPNIPESLRNLNGCPFRVEDLYWVSRQGVTTLSAGLRTAADESGARFLDMSRAGTGHEACSGGADPSREWFSRLTVQWKDLTEVDRANHALQESFHPNAAGHAAFGRCLSEFLGSPDRVAACLPGADGALHPAKGVTAP